MGWCPARIREAADAARRAIGFVQGDFGERARLYLRCDGRCGDARCPRELRFETGVGIDDGIITASRLLSGRLTGEEIIGRCVNIASKLSGVVRPPFPIGITREAYDLGELAKDRSHTWQARRVEVAGRLRPIMVSGLARGRAALGDIALC